jgi:hypothetical protein
MDTKGPFYLKGSRNKHYFIHVIDDCCSRKVVSKWCDRRTSEKALSVFKEWIELYGKPMKVMHMMVVENLHLINSKIILDSME